MIKKENRICCKCNHCGNEGYLDIKGTYQETIGENDNDIGFIPTEVLTFYLLECPICLNPIIVQESCDLCFEDSAPKLKLLYPNDSIRTEFAPKEISKTYMNLKEIYRRNDLDSCLAVLRILLEKIANDQKAEGSSLDQKIKDLAKKKIIPTTIENLSNILRKLGNKGAHGESGVLSKKETKMLITFLSI